MIGPSYFPEALAELEDVVTYYETKEADLGTRVLVELDDAVARVVAFPEAATYVQAVPERHGLRWVRLASFPLKVVYTVKGQHLVIVAVFHLARRPGYWMQRLEKLG